LLRELRLWTEAAYPSAGHMCSGPMQGRLLSLLAKLVGARRALEVGTFTGYSALCLAEGGAEVTTLEADPRAAAAARAFVARSHATVTVVEGNAAASIAALAASAASAASGGNGPASAGGGGPSAHASHAHAFDHAFDLVFLDADKRSYGAYLDALLGSALVRPGTLILVDNVLWRGRVLDCQCGPRNPAHSPAHSACSSTAASGSPDGGISPEAAAKAARRDGVLAQAMHEFNVKVRRDGRLEQVVLPLRDGLSLIRVR
jgi:caffeoyl-CoA O-methyltransferase